MASTRTSFRLLHAPAFAILLVLVAFEARAEREIAVKRCTMPPTMDGKLDDACWREAAPLKDFALLKTHKPASQQTEAKVCFNDRALYFGITCFENEMGQIKAAERKRDGAVYEDDAVEVFLAAEHGLQAASATPYYHFVLNAAGTQRDDEGASPSWNARWTTAVGQEKDRWTVEIAIPFDQIPIPADAAGTWLFNIARHEVPHNELSTWSPCDGGFHEVKNFARLTGVTVDLTPLAKANALQRLSELREQLSQAEAALPRAARSAFANNAKAQRGEVAKTLDAISAGIERAWTMEALRTEAQRLEQAAREATGLLAQCTRASMVEQARRGAGPDPDILICRESTMTKIRGDRPYWGTPVAEVSISLARNEYEAAQIVVVPVAKALKNVRVTVTPLKDKDGRSVMASEDIRVERVGYVQTAQPSGGARGPAGRLPDPLIPISAFDIDANGAQPVWITLFARPGLRGGEYAGEILVEVDGGAPARVALKARVFDFDLPKTSALRTCFLLNPGFIAQRHKLSGPWAWGCNDEHYQRDPKGVMITETNAAQGKRALTGRSSTSQYIHFYIPGSYENKNTHVSFAYRSDDPGTLLLMFSPGKNYSIAPKEQTPGAWHRCDIALGETHAPEGVNGALCFYHDNHKSGKEHSFFIDDVVIYQQAPGGEKKVLFAEDFEKGLVSGGLADLVRAYRLNMLEHRCSDANVAAPEVKTAQDGTVSMDWTEFDEEIQFYLDRGLNGFNLPWLRIGGGWGEVQTPEAERELQIARQILEQTQAHLEQKGWLKYAYIYTIDEPGAKAFAKVKKAFGLAHEYGPKLKRLLTYGYGATRPWKPGVISVKPAYAELLDFVDIHVPHIDCFDPVTMDVARKMPWREIWEYICISGQHPYPNMWAVDYSGTENRICYWQLWRYNVTGYLYWAVNYWKEDVWNNPLSYPGGNGDGSLLYWGTKETGLPAGMADRPINSIRWELTRDGIEDYDYLAMLDDLAKKAVAAKDARGLSKEAQRLLDVSQVCESFTKYTADPAVIEQRREAMGALIEHLSHELSPAMAR